MARPAFARILQCGYCSGRALANIYAQIRFYVHFSAFAWEKPSSFNAGPSLTWQEHYHDAYLSSEVEGCKGMESWALHRHVFSFRLGDMCLANSAPPIAGVLAVAWPAFPRISQCGNCSGRAPAVERKRNGRSLEPVLIGRHRPIRFEIVVRFSRKGGTVAPLFIHTSWPKSIGWHLCSGLKPNLFPQTMCPRLAW